MSNTAELELVPQQDELSEKTFEDQSEYDLFWHRLLERVEPQLKKFAEARRASEEAAKRRRTV
jgi:hypothetical protein